MTITLFKRVAYGLIGLSLVFVFLGLQKMGSSMPAAAAALTPTPTPTPAPTPTRPSYNCGDIENPDYITFKWTRRMPNGGWLGEVTYGKIVSKPIQVFDAKVNNDLNLTDWTFQAQDGSFLCHMYVSPITLKRNVWFGRCRNNNWPQPSCGTDRLAGPPPN